MALASKTFNFVCRILVAKFFDRYVRLPETDEEWEAEMKGFIENYEFPCVGVWDGFHVPVSTKLKSFYGFKKRYIVSNLDLVIHAAVVTPGSTHDAGLLRNRSIYEAILDNRAVPQ